MPSGCAVAASARAERCPGAGELARAKHPLGAVAVAPTHSRAALGFARTAPPGDREPVQVGQGVSRCAPPRSRGACPVRGGSQSSC